MVNTLSWPDVWSELSSVSISSDSSVVAAGSNDNSIRLWNSVDGSLYGGTSPCVMH